jgi:hypothetical protein
MWPVSIDSFTLTSTNLEMEYLTNNFNVFFKILYYTDRASCDKLNSTKKCAR